MDKDNKKKKITDFDKVLDSFCTEEAELERAFDALHKIFVSLMKVGFTENQAMAIVISMIEGGTK